MAKHTIESYSCDNCDKKLTTSRNTMDIASKNEPALGWSRLHVRIVHVHSSFNNGDKNDTELCQACAIKLLQNALKRVENGERATGDSHSIKEERWD